MDVLIMNKKPFFPIATCHFVLSFVTVLFGHIGITGAEPPNLQQRVPASFELAAQNKQGYEEAQRSLMALPSVEAIPAILSALEVSDVSSRVDLRKLAYKLLIHHPAVESQAGFERLKRGLGDPSPEIQRLCCEALGANAVNEEMNLLLTKLDRTTMSNNERWKTIRKIGGWGVYAVTAYDAILAIFRDESEEVKLRATAASAMVEIGGLERSLKDFRDTTGPVVKYQLGAFGQFIGERDDACRAGRRECDDQYRQARSKVREYVLEKLFNDDREVRLVAFQVLCTSYGPDWVIFHTDEDYEWNPVLRTAMEKMAANESDSQLREAAEHHLNFSLDKAAAKLLRLKRRHQEQQK